MTFEKEENDQFLFAQMRLGKEEAFDFIFRKYYKVLASQAIRIVQADEIAQCLVQDCFVRFWEKRLELSNVEDFYSYLFFMVRNRCLDHLREIHRIQKVPINDNLSFMVNEVEEKIDADDLGIRLWKAIAGLPERCRLAFEYSRIDGYTYAQIAEKMGISNKAVEALISRALKILRTNLTDFLGICVWWLL